MGLRERLSRSGKNKAGGETPEKPDLLEYLGTLPEVEDPYPPFAEEEPKQPAGDSVVDQWLLMIAQASRQGKLVPERELACSGQDRDAALEELSGLPQIRRQKGKTDVYYSHRDYMTDFYAEIMTNVMDKDIPATIAAVTRRRSRYPATTAMRHFTREPYYWTRQQIERAYTMMQREEEYCDIAMVTAVNGEPHFYSRNDLSDTYGKALADDAEEEDM